MRTLPAGDYCDRSVHEAERAAIFARSWLCMGPRWFPTAPTRCSLVLDFCFADTSDAAADRNRRDIAASQQTCLEDQLICQAVQRNLDAGAYEDGVLAPRHESAVADFQQRVRAARGVEGASEP